MIYTPYPGIPNPYTCVIEVSITTKFLHPKEPEKNVLKPPNCTRNIK